MNKRVLLVEDHDSLRTMLGAFLSKTFEVTSAKNGLDAMALLNRGIQPDIIVTDAKMPDLDGENLIHNLRCSGIYADIPVIVVSGLPDDKAGYFKTLGVLDFIKKPFNPASLQDRMLEIIG